MNGPRTFALMVALTLLFVLVGGFLGGRQGALLAFLLAAGINFFTMDLRRFCCCSRTVFAFQLPSKTRLPNLRAIAPRP